MRAKPGDRLEVSGHRVGEPVRHAERLEVRGDKGQPSYYERWADGHESLVYPGPDTHLGSARARARGEIALSPGIWNPGLDLDWSVRR